MKRTYTDYLRDILDAVDKCRAVLEALPNFV